MDIHKEIAEFDELSKTIAASNLSLTEELRAIQELSDKMAPPQILQSVDEIKAAFESENVIKVGTTIPEFKLSDATGNIVSSSELVAKGPVLIIFYRGGWCPYCNLALAAYQKHLDEFKEKGVTVIGISPQLPDTSLTVAEKNALKFTVLSDVGNELGRKLGLVWTMPEYLRPFLKQFGADIEGGNGDDTFEVPVPANILVDGKGVVQNVYTNPDYRKRLDPAVALEWADAL
ncbi:redoxin domain-containing protein [Apodospora peruviana]|uniref:thioredoxin-dependent peroxiredoxin n=1 Tax=Apodospora peruviana TaxID=516989 RepID=A0AAE0M1H6_9PEZI|nr:redoxin domain-containing protein [Apodospora peruviana]